LIGAGDAVHGNGLPSFGEALLFFARPFDPRLGRRRVLLPFLPPLRRRCQLRRVVLLVDLGLLLFFFVDVLGGVSEPVDAAATASVALASSCVKNPDSTRRPWIPT
jgi:hypothetical protein